MPEIVNAVDLVDRIARVALAVALAFAIGIVAVVGSGSALPGLAVTAMAPIARF